MRTTSILALTVTLLAAGCGRDPSPPSPPAPKPPQRDGAVKPDIPKGKGQPDGPSPLTAEVLRQLPGVARVEVLVSAANPKHRIIHIGDWPYVPKDRYAPELRKAGLTPEEVEEGYREFLDDVERVQQEQERLLAHLVAAHGLRRVLHEGLTPEQAGLYRQKVEAARVAGPALREQLGKARARLKGLKEGTEEHQKALGLQRQALSLLREHRLEVLRLGAPGRLLARGEVEVLPLDDAGLLGGAKPPRGGGAEPVSAKTRARQDGQVRAALASGPCAVLILSGGQDLSDSVRRLGGRAAEYLRVTMAAHASGAN
jgi:hypothetical protein